MFLQILSSVMSGKLVDMLRCKYYLLRGPKELGPYTCDELVRLVKDGMVGREELIRHDTEPGKWVPVGEYLKSHIEEAE
jgi:hypothetical protein